jgi:hypothetical protein
LRPADRTLGRLLIRASLTSATLQLEGLLRKTEGIVQFGITFLP